MTGNKNGHEHTYVKVRSLFRRSKLRPITTQNVYLTYDISLDNCHRRQESLKVPLLYCWTIERCPYKSL